MATQKTLRVCLSRDFPLLVNRDSDMIYFLYDKLFVFFGQNQFNDPYVIVEEIPTNPADGYLYFVLEDGTARYFTGEELQIIGNIESEDQLDLLKQSGSLFFANANRRYLDFERRIVTLPYLNGTYELTVNLAKDILINEDTVIAFNPETNTFEISGKKASDVYFRSDHYKGKNTNTVNTTVSDLRISSEVKISKVFNNIIKIYGDGLYANAEDRVTKKQFESWAEKYRDYKVDMESYLEILDEKIHQAEQIVSPQSIIQKINEALILVYPEIDATLAKYEEIASSMEDLEERVFAYATDRYDSSYLNLYEIMTDASENIWQTFEDEIREQEEEGSDML